MTVEWLAGFFDGEGCVGAAMGPSGSPTPRVSIHNTHKETMDALVTFIGGDVKLYERPKIGGRQILYSIHIQKADQVCKLLSALYPHLHIKKEQAKLGIELARRVSERVGVSKIKGSPISPEEFDIRHSLYEAIKHCNQGTR